MNPNLNPHFHPDGIGPIFPVDMSDPDTDRYFCNTTSVKGAHLCHCCVSPTSRGDDEFHFSVGVCQKLSV